ncbi:MAG: hypothetical protein JXM70_07810 [Pirellulales bacterium]|nr:hypothetical protein [Pirellulales bacterium]
MSTDSQSKPWHLTLTGIVLMVLGVIAIASPEHASGYFFGEVSILISI